MPLRVCPGCGARFEPISPTRKYCRPSCKAKHEYEQQRDRRSSRGDVPTLDFEKSEFIDDGDQA